jgi:hypothetical protein
MSVPPEEMAEIATSIRKELDGDRA